MVKMMIPGGHRTRRFCCPLFHPNDEHEFYAGSEKTQKIGIDTLATPGPAFYAIGACEVLHRILLAHPLLPWL